MVSSSHFSSGCFLIFFYSVFSCGLSQNIEAVQKNWQYRGMLSDVLEAEISLTTEQSYQSLLFVGFLVFWG